MIKIEGATSTQFITDWISFEFVSVNAFTGLHRRHCLTILTNKDYSCLDNGFSRQKFQKNTFYRRELEG